MQLLYVPAKTRCSLDGPSEARAGARTATIRLSEPGIARDPLASTRPQTAGAVVGAHDGSGVEARWQGKLG
jgi:hypothetical protein